MEAARWFLDTVPEPRGKGGDDPTQRQITLCRCCHLRLIHAAGAPVTVKQVEDVMVWSWPDRVVVVGP